MVVAELWKSQKTLPVKIGVLLANVACTDAIPKGPSNKWLTFRAIKKSQKVEQNVRTSIRLE